MRRFAVLGHRTDAHSTWSLNDLPGSGRADVLIRNVTAALLDSHGIRSDVEVILHLMAGAGTGRRLRINGSDLRGLQPDERSAAGLIMTALSPPTPPRGRWVGVRPGLEVSSGGLAVTLDEWSNLGVTSCVLDAGGQPVGGLQVTEDMGFILSDDRPFTEDDHVVMAGLQRVSLGQRWMQGHASIHVIHHHLDEGSRMDGNPSGPG